MKSSVLVLAGILAFGVPTAARQTVGLDSLSAAQSATLDIAADVDGLPVFLDGRRIGETPLAGQRIDTGPHELAVQSPYGAVWNQPHYSASFVAVPGQNYRFKAAFEKKISINSQPYGAKVYRDTTKIGYTPLSVNSAEKEVLLVHPGYEPYTLDLSKIEGVSAVVILQPQEQWVLSQERSERIFRNKMRNRQKMMFVSMGFSAIAGLLTIHFRSEGNEEYSRYLETAVPAEMERYYKNAQNFDRLAGLSYALFELGFVLTGYYFLTSRGIDDVGF
jgi:hypothetical protein